MRKIFNLGKLSLVLALCVSASGVWAGVWSWTTPIQGPERKVITLVITGNYQHPLALAQLMQTENRQPYLLVPAKETGDKAIFFCPANTRRVAMEIQEADLHRFVEFLNPKQIIILGDTRYVPAKYEPVLANKIPILRITSDDWRKNAEVFGRMLNLNNLSDDYQAMAPKLEARALYAPIPRPRAHSAAAQAPTEITIEDNNATTPPGLDSVKPGEASEGDVKPVSEDQPAAPAASDKDAAEQAPAK